jgi:hypothetical protein
MSSNTTTVPLAESQACTAREQRLAGALELELDLPGLVVARGEELLAYQRSERLQRLRPLVELHACAGVELGAENSARAVVRDRKRKLRIEHQHACGQVRKNVLEARLGGFQRGAIGLDHLARFVELTRHRIERLGEHAEFVAAGDRRLSAEVAARHRLGGLRQICQRLGQAPGEDHRKRDRDEQRHEERKGQRNDVDELEFLARQRKFPVVAVRGFDGFDAAAEQVRNRLPQLQVTSLLPDRPGERNDDAQRESLARRRVHGVVAARDARLAQHLRRRQLGHQARHVRARAQRAPCRLRSAAPRPAPPPVRAAG